MADNGLTGFAVTSTIGESGWQWSVGCYHAENKTVTRTMIEAAIIVPRIELCELDPDSDKWEHSHRKFIELSSCSSDHSPDYIVRLSWQLNLRRQAWWDLPCRITWQWTISSWNKTGSSTYIRLLISPVSTNFPAFESPRNAILNNSCMGLNVCNQLHEAQACFQGSRSIQSPQSYFRKCDCTIP